VRLGSDGNTHLPHVYGGQDITSKLEALVFLNKGPILLNERLSPDAIKPNAFGNHGLWRKMDRGKLLVDTGRDQLAAQS
jgi:hypothetical protein